MLLCNRSGQWVLAHTSHKPLANPRSKLRSVIMFNRQANGNCFSFYKTYMRVTYAYSNYHHWHTHDVYDLIKHNCFYTHTTQANKFDHVKNEHKQFRSLNMYTTLTYTH